ncbi:MAG: ABC transporter ATP-binding protein [Burkholderiales bacterium]|nr:MAG: ABC transporter ATP-binding protein [Burkholderiales bacterium]
MLEVRGLEAGYGSLKVLRGISFSVPTGKVVALLGGNGAGKTTTMAALTGIVRPTAGTVTLDGEALQNQPSYRILRKGIALVPQGRQLFPEMSVLENLETGAFVRGRRGAELEADLAQVFERFPRLKERATQRAGSLSGGEQQMLATGRALMARPQLLLMDEPTTGLAPIIVQELTRIIRDLHRAGQTIVLVEQNVRMALQVADHVYVIRGGQIVQEASADSIRDDEEMFRAYLG